MSQKSDDLKMLTNKYNSMNIDELQKSIEQLEKNADSPIQHKNIDITKNELEHIYKERQKQVELLTKSLTSSSRLVRWISSVRSVLIQLVMSKN